MSYYRTCPHCGAHLDPGEVCDCIPSLYATLGAEDRQAVDVMIHWLVKQKKTAQSATDTLSGKKTPHSP